MENNFIQLLKLRSLDQQASLLKTVKRSLILMMPFMIFRVSGMAGQENRQIRKSK